MADRSGQTETLLAVEAIIARVDEVMKELDALATNLQAHRRGLFESARKLRAARE
jgi:hypothetical protein